MDNAFENQIRESFAEDDAQVHLSRQVADKMVRRLRLTLPNTTRKPFPNLLLLVLSLLLTFCLGYAGGKAVCPSILSMPSRTRNTDEKTVAEIRARYEAQLRVFEERLEIILRGLTPTDRVETSARTRVQNREQRIAALEKQIDFLSTIDTSDFTEKPIDTHYRLLALIKARIACERALASDSLSDEARRTLEREIETSEHELHEAYFWEGRRLVRLAVARLGYQGAEAKTIRTMFNDIRDATSAVMP